MLLTLVAWSCLSMPAVLLQDGGATGAASGSASEDVAVPLLDAPVWRMSLDTAITVGGKRSLLQDVFQRAGDINRDGRQDVLIGSQSAGTLTVRSGRDGQVILGLSGDPATGFGQSAAAAGDVDGDGYDDIIHGESGYATDAGPLGRAVVTSGRTGKTLLVIPGQLAGDLAGYSVSGVSDLDGDGYDDVGVGSPGVSRVCVHSGADGAVLLDIEAAVPPDSIGELVRGAGDVDGDGVPDVLIGILDITTGELCRSARVHSGEDGSILFTIAAGPATHQVDLAMDAAGDVDGDGLADIVVLLREGSETSAGVFGGPDGRRISQNPTPGFPAGVNPPIVDVAGAGDVDGDGHDDILVGTLELPTGGYGVYSGATNGFLRTGAFVGDPHVALHVSVAGGGDVNGDGFADPLLSIHQAEWAVGISPSRGRVIFGGDPWFIRLGDRIRDQLPPGALDIVAFDAVAGTRLDVAMRSVGKPGFVPGLTLVGHPLPPGSFGPGAVARIRKFELPETGSYTLDLGFGLPPTGAGGKYTLRTRARPPRGKGLVEAVAPGEGDASFVPGHRVHGVVTAGQPTTLSVDLAAGSLLSLRARAIAGSTLDPVLAVLDPQGAELPGDEAPQHGHRILRLPIPATGTYTVQVLGDGSTAGEFLLRTKARTPRGKARIRAPESLEFP